MRHIGVDCKECVAVRERHHHHAPRSAADRRAGECTEIGAQTIDAKRGARHQRGERRGGGAACATSRFGGGDPIVRGDRATARLRAGAGVYGRLHGVPRGRFPARLLRVDRFNDSDRNEQQRQHASSWRETGGASHVARPLRRFFYATAPTISRTRAARMPRHTPATPPSVQVSARRWPDTQSPTPISGRWVSGPSTT